MKQAFQLLKHIAPYVLIVSMLLHVHGFIKFVDQGHDWGGDFSLYLNQAEAIADGTTSTLNEINRESMLGSMKRNGPDLYPPGYPLMLFPLMELFGRNMVVFKSLNLFYFLASLGLMVFILQPFTGRSAAHYFASFLALHPFFMGFEHEVISDIPALFFGLLALHLFLASKGRLTYLFASGLALGFGILVKSLLLPLAGALLVSLGIYFLVKREARIWRQFGALLLGLIPIILLSKWIYPGSSSSYMEQLKELTFSRLYDNLVYNLYLPREFLFNSDLLFYLFGFFFLTGLVVNIRRIPYSPFYWLFLFHLLLLVIWPFHEGPRFMFILFPVIGLMLIKGLRFWMNKGKWVKVSMTLYAVVLMLHFPFHTFPVLFGAEKTSYQNLALTKDARDLYQFVQETSKADEELIFFKPRVVRYFTGRQAYILEDRQAADTSGARWYIRYDPWGGFDTEGYSQVFDNATFTVFDMKPE